jgi:hypothetical protein
MTGSEKTRAATKPSSTAELLNAARELAQLPSVTPFNQTDRLLPKITQAPNPPTDAAPRRPYWLL